MTATLTHLIFLLSGLLIIKKKAILCFFEGAILMSRIALFFRKEWINIMNVFSMEELSSLLVATTQENEKLREDNQRLLLIVADATKQIKEASNMAEKYQRMFNNLSESVEAKYDNEFNIDNIPGQ